MEATARIFQRSGSKHIKTTLLDMSRWCTVEKDAPQTESSLVTALGMVQQHAVDSYYQVILKKYQGVETLRLVASTFPLIEVVELVESILKLLLENEDDAGKADSSISTASDLGSEHLSMVW
jgi:hypothetical protein